jgi:hypothetical protein
MSTRKFNNTKEFVEHLILQHLTGNIMLDYDELQDHRRDPQYYDQFPDVYSVHTEITEEYCDVNKKLFDEKGKLLPTVTLSQIIEETVKLVDNPKNNQIIMELAPQYTQLMKEYGPFMREGEQKMGQQALFQTEKYKKMERKRFELWSKMRDVVEEVFVYFISSYDGYKGEGGYALYNNLHAYYKNREMF